MALPIVTSIKYETVIPSMNKTVEFRPYVVKEEKILMIAMESKDQAQIVMALKDVIGACVSQSIDTSKLTMFDIESLFLRLRSKSVGENVEVTLKCTECSHPHPIDINLDEVKVPEVFEANKTISINDQIGIVMRYPSIDDMKQYSEEQLGSVDGIMSLMVDCIVTIFDADNVYNTADEPRKNIVDFIESLSSGQFGKIAKFFSEMPGLVHVIDFNCKKCSTDNTLELKGIQSFFM
tara:strand:+ start:4928 stop:5635 length:708 start_codon:yes stop_codon:yes gene_type:complete